MLGIFKSKLEIGGKKYTPQKLAELFFFRMGYGDTLEGIIAGRIHDRGSRKTIRVYSKNDGDGVLIGKIRITEYGASYNGLRPDHASDEEGSPEDLTDTYYIGANARAHFLRLRESVDDSWSVNGFHFGVPEEEPFTNFMGYIDLSLEDMVSSYRN